MSNGYDRVPVEHHAEVIAALLGPLRERPLESVPLDEALGRVTAEPVFSPIDLPPFRNSQMDGFAVRSLDVAPDAGLPIVGEIAAAPGSPPALAPGTTVRIMTGAPVPAGADAVIPVEASSAAGGTVSFSRRPRVGEFVREAGSDLPAGGEVLPAGIRLASRHVAALAASGLTEVAVLSRVRVAVVSSGSELAEPGEPLVAGRIPDSNGVALAAAVVAAGARLVLRGRVSDDVYELRRLLDAAVEAGSELIVTSGGISMGEHEVVRELLEPLGALVGTVAMQPGGPQASATYSGVPIVCFPGNPVSSQLSFELFVAPLLRRLAGLPQAVRAQRELAEPVRSPQGRRQYLRGRMLADGRVHTVGGPSSHLVAALAASDVLLVIPEDVVELAAGDFVETLAL